MNKIYIDTTDNKKVIVQLTTDKEEEAMEQPMDTRKAQIALPMVYDLLKKHGLEPKDLTEITVHEGPGSFTGVRVGVAIANALAFGLNIPVNGAKIVDGKTLIEPKY